MSDNQNQSHRYDAVAELARTMPYEPSSTQLVHGWRRIQASVGKADTGTSGARWFAALGVAACIAAIIATKPWQRHDQTLSYVVDNGVRGPAGQVTAGDVSQAKVAFSDGTEFVLSPHAHATVGSLGTNEPHVSLDDGRTEVRVHHRDGARWLVSAGPFVVSVTGTSFALAWTAGDRFDIHMHSGTVTVKGPVIEEGRTLAGDQWLTIRVQAREIGIGTGEPNDAPGEQPPKLDSGEAYRAKAPPELAPEPAPRPAEGHRAPAIHADQPASMGWSELLARGKPAEIVADAEARGLEAATLQVGSDDLAALADAARYTRRADIARRALNAQRARFPGATHARDAAFYLGRLDESSGAAASAMTWYGRYLDEAADGTYASEALGREMSLILRLQGKTNAQPLAEQYLARFPSGSYAASARSLLGRP